MKILTQLLIQESAVGGREESLEIDHLVLDREIKSATNEEVVIISGTITVSP